MINRTCEPGAERDLICWMPKTCGGFSCLFLTPFPLSFPPFTFSLFRNPRPSPPSPAGAPSSCPLPQYWGRSFKLSSPSPPTAIQSTTTNIINSQRQARLPQTPPLNHIAPTTGTKSSPGSLLIMSFALGGLAVMSGSRPLASHFARLFAAVEVRSVFFGVLVFIVILILGELLMSLNSACDVRKSLHCSSILKCFMDQTLNALIQRI